jgi:hypothetical protein
VLAAEQLGGDPQVLDTPIGAGPEEDGVHLDLAQRRTGRQAHVGQRLLDVAPLVLVGEFGRVGHDAGDRQALAGVGAPGDVGGQRRGVDVHLAVEDGVLVGAQRRPVLDGGVPVRTLRGVRAALQEVERGLVGGDQPRLGAGLDRHVADRHPGFHGQLLDGAAPVFDDVALTAARADLGDDGEDDVLRRDAGRQFTVDRDGHLLGLVLRQRLRGQHVLDLAGPDAERQRTERPVRGGVAVAADDRHARLGQPELRTDHVHDPLVPVAHGSQPDAELRGVLPQRLDLGPADRVGDRGEDVQRRDVVVLGRHREFGTPDRAPRCSETVEGLRARDLVHEVQVDVEQVGLAGGAAHHVGLVDLLRQGLRHCCSPPVAIPLFGMRVLLCGTA